MKETSKGTVTPQSSLRAVLRPLKHIDMLRKWTTAWTTEMKQRDGNDQMKFACTRPKLKADKQKRYSSCQSISVPCRVVPKCRAVNREFAEIGVARSDTAAAVALHYTDRFWAPTADTGYWLTAALFAHRTHYDTVIAFSYSLPTYSLYGTLDCSHIAVGHAFRTFVTATTNFADRRTSSPFTRPLQRPCRAIR